MLAARLVVDRGTLSFDEIVQRRRSPSPWPCRCSANVVFEMGSLLGFGTVKNLLTGRYVRPRREQRAFLLIDMKNSTGIAERLGADAASTSC